MRPLYRSGSLQTPWRLLCHRCLSTTPLVYRQPSKKSGKKFADRARSNFVNKGNDLQTRVRSDKKTGPHAVFHTTVLLRFEEVLKRLETAKFAPGLDDDELDRQAGLFMDALDEAFKLAAQGAKTREQNPLFWNLKEAFIAKDLKGLTKEVQYSFQSFLIRQRFSKQVENSHKRLLNFQFPHEWFPATRAVQRTIHVHVGPTNSGKTYNALKALENSKSGVYAGPLRLLANEVYQRFTAKGIPCALLTGEEVRIPENTDRYFSSCTVEMVPLNERFDVAVIDEIQMISDPDRGNAWTTALLGVQAKEVHVCGEDRAVSLIQSICASVGDECVVHRYERLSPLVTAKDSLGSNFSKLQKGDAVVAFSRMSLHMMKRTIEKKTGRRCAIIYGALPPEVRVQQAALFNDPNNDYDFVVASDAIGMGLNLEIRRVVMESITKFDGAQNRHLTHPEIKQIGGRAGRYRSAQNPDGSVNADQEEKLGVVTAIDKQDLRGIRRAFDAPVADLKVAYIAPPSAVIERFSTYFPHGTPLSFILMRIKELSTISSRYQLGISTDTLEIADLIQDIPLSVYDRLTLCHIPMSTRSEVPMQMLRALAKIIATSSNGDLLSIEELPLEFLDMPLESYPGRPTEFLYKLEQLHVAINGYVWLSYRYSGMFKDQALAFHIRSLIEQKLVETLEKLDFTEKEMEERRSKRRVKAAVHRREKNAYGEGDLEGVEQEMDDPPIEDGPEPEWRPDVPASLAAVEPDGNNAR